MNEAIFEYEKLEDCPYCSFKGIQLILKAPDRLTEVPGVFYLSKCKRCGLIFQNPRVKKEFIRFFYRDSLGYYNPPVSENDWSKRKKWIKRFKNYLRNQTLINHFNYTNLGNRNFILKLITIPFKRILKIQLAPQYVKGGRLLEIGCSYGGRLENLRAIGWKVEGIEMDERSSKYAREIKKLKVENNEIEEADFPFKTFDVVVMSMVLEHLYNPFEILKRITKWLKPKGQLIFSIPYIEGFEGEVFREYYYSLHLPHHLIFFNKRIIKEYLTSLGYTKIRFYFHFFDRDIVASAYYKYVDTKKWWWKIVSKNKPMRFLLIKPFVFFLSLINKTSRVTVFAEKV